MITSTIQHESINSIIEWFLNRFGKARTALYTFPYIENNNSFTTYLNSLMASLRRIGYYPMYAWSYDSSRDRHNLLLIVSGYCRNDMNDITETAQRIWKLYSPFQIEFIAEMPLEIDTIDSDKMRLFCTMNEMDFVPSVPQRLLPAHQRNFACSRLI